MTRLLVIRFSALGDVAIAVPIVRALAEQYPDLDITMLSRKNWEPMFLAMPTNVHFYGADLKHRHHGTDGLKQLLQDINYRQFDAVADLHGVLRSFYIDGKFLLSGKPVKMIHKSRLKKWYLCRPWNRHKQFLPSSRERYLDVFARLGYPVTLHDQQVILHDENKRNIGIAPFAAHKGKIYPLPKMEKVVSMLGKELDKRDEKVLLFGAGPTEKAILDRWAKKYIGVVSMVGKLPLNMDIETMSTLRLMLTMDSGNHHLSSLARTRCLSIWGATDIKAGFLAYGQSPDDCIQRDLPCRPCSTYGNKPCRYHDWRCLDIDPEEIVERIMTIYET